MRFLPLLQARELHFMVQPQLLRLLRGMPGLGQVRDYWTDAALPPHDVDLEVMELAYALRATASCLPPPPSQLAAGLPAAPLQLADDGRLRVGLLWAASAWDDSRSVPLATLAPLFALEQVRFHALQQGEAACDPLLRHFDIARLSPYTAEVAAAAAVMLKLDLVLGIDAMPAHLAATLGRPTWVLLKHDADWRWMRGRTDSPWYPGMRLFRQPRPGDWEAVVDAVAAALVKLAAGVRSPA